MRSRCYSPSSKQYKDYGGRGITVCAEWRNDFNQFVQDMGPRPEGFTLERKNNNKGYSLGNCKWASRKEQQRNRRNTIKLVIDGREFRAADLADINGVKPDTIVARHRRGFSFLKIIQKDRLPEVTSNRRKEAGAKASKTRREKTHCKRGHLFDQKNTYKTKKGTRLCRKCDALRARGLHR